jgi:uncharacterized protein
MQNWKAILAGSSIVVLLLFLIYLFSYGIVDIQVDYLWFKSLGFETYFILKESYINTVDILVGSFFFLIFLTNLRLTETFLPKPGQADPGQAESIDGYKSGSLMRRLLGTSMVRIYVPLSLLLTVPIMIPIHDQWESAIFYFYGDTDTGIVDPAYQRDIGFYLFSYPFYELLQQELVITFTLLLLTVGLIYSRRKRQLEIVSRGLPGAAGTHFNILLFALSLILIWGFLLNRYELLYVSRHEPAFYGPGFIEMRYLLPLIWVECLAFLIATLSLILYHVKEKGLQAFFLSGFCFVIALALLKIDYLPELLEKYWVKANPVVTEREFMEYNIASTLAGYGLDDVTVQNYDPRDDPDEPPGLDEKLDLSNIPVWEPDLLDDVYNQLEAVRPYYDFRSIDVDRYTIEGYYQQVNLAAREINFRTLPFEAKTWANLHLRYTHGYGAVITPAYQQGEKPMRCFLCGIDLNSPVGIRINHPEVYYGTGHYTYAIVPNRMELGQTDEIDRTTARRYEGSGDLGIDTPILGKLLFALYFQEPNIYFSSAIDENSRVLIHRNIRERIKKLAPFLKLDADPYLVVTEDRLYWILDAYTTSEFYPISKPSEFTFYGDQEPTRFNYIRNSVKIVVDAYDGSTHFYRVDEKDPMVRAFDRAFPGLFRTIDQMPETLRSHLRYPEDLFSLQMEIYAKYHQTEPELFYQDSQSWEFAKMEGKTVKPYYVTIHRQGTDQQIFVMIGPMTPVGLDNLSALVLAGCFNRLMCGKEYSPQLTVFRFPIDYQVDGPGQISALINQNAQISQKLTLWDQKGSEIKRGRMLILPIGNNVLYIQPVYLLSQSRTRIPQLVRVIVAKDKETVIDESPEAALARIEELKQGRLSRERGIEALSLPATVPAPYIPPSQRKK